MSICKKVLYKKNSIILYSGDNINFIGLILSGCVQIIKEDINGKIAILAELGASDTFAEVSACAGISHNPVTAQSCEDAEVLFLDYKKL